jgi:hypothetical protein
MDEAAQKQREEIATIGTQCNKMLQYIISITHITNKLELFPSAGEKLNCSVTIMF